MATIHRYPGGVPQHYVADNCVYDGNGRAVGYIDGDTVYAYGGRAILYNVENYLHPCQRGPSLLYFGEE